MRSLESAYRSNTSWLVKGCFISTKGHSVRFDASTSKEARVQRVDPNVQVSPLRSHAVELDVEELYIKSIWDHWSDIETRISLDASPTSDHYQQPEPALLSRRLRQTQHYQCQVTVMTSDLRPSSSPN